jgi:protein-tyrosine-phosphatase
MSLTDTRVLVLCTDDTVRGLMVVALLGRLFASQGRRDVAVNSAGLATLDGTQASVLAVEALRARGLDISAHHSRTVTPQMAQKADLVLAVDVDVYRRAKMAGMDSERPGKVNLLLGYPQYSNKSPDLVDPFGQPLAAHQNRVAQIETALAQPEFYLRFNLDFPALNPATMERPTLIVPANSQYPGDSLRIEAPTARRWFFGEK